MTTTWRPMTAPSATSAWSPYIQTSWRRADTAATPTSCSTVACATLIRDPRLSTTSTTTTSSASAPTVNEACLRLTASCQQDPPVRPRLLVRRRTSSSAGHSVNTRSAQLAVPHHELVRNPDVYVARSTLNMNSTPKQRGRRGFKSRIVDAGWGLFAARDFKRDELVLDPP